MINLVIQEKIEKVSHLSTLRKSADVILSGSSSELESSSSLLSFGDEVPVKYATSERVFEENANSDDPFWLSC